MNEKRSEPVAGESIRFNWFSDYSRDGLRTHYRPPCRIYSGFFAVVPWLNVLLLVAAFVMLTRPSLVVPGVQVDLPTQAVHDGMRSSIVLVVKVLPPHTVAHEDAAVVADDGATVAPLDLEVFFNDDRFDLSQAHHIATFRNDLSSAIAGWGETKALLYLDKDITHENTMRFAKMLGDAGITRVCYVVKAR